MRIQFEGINIHYDLIKEEYGHQIISSFQELMMGVIRTSDGNVFIRNARGLWNIRTEQHGGNDSYIARKGEGIYQ
jgi:hypothetical protein